MHATIVIPNWNGEVLLRKHLHYVVQAANGAEILIVDDASTDASVSYIRSQYPAIAIIEMKENKGFSSAVNLGVLHAKGEIIVLINTDVVPRAGFLDQLLVHFTDPTVFAVGCLEKSHEKNGVISRGRGVAKWIKGYYLHSRGTLGNTTTAWVSGGSGAFRKSIWVKLGGMDERFNPYYWEDIDLSYRARKAGYTVIFEPKSVVDHYHDDGIIKRTVSSQEISRSAYRNQYVFIWKNCTSIPIFFTHVWYLPIRLIQALLRGDSAHLMGFMLALYLVPSIIRTKISSFRTWKRSDHELEVD